MPTATPEFFTKIAEATKLELSFVTEEYNKIFASLPDSDNKENAAIYQLTTALKAHKRSNAVPCEGVILGFTRPFDYNTGPKNKQIKALKKLMADSESTIPEQWMIDQLIASGDAAPESLEGMPIIWLDTKASFKSGKANPNHGKPWSPAETTTIMNIYGVAKPSNSVEGKDIPMRLFNIAVSNPEWFTNHGGVNNLTCNKALQTCVQFRAKMLFYADKSTNTLNALNVSSLTEFEYFDSIDILAFAKTFIPDRVQTISTLEEHYQKFGNKEFVIVEAGVQNMKMTPSPIGMRTFYVDDPYMDPLLMFSDEGVAPDTRVEVPKEVPITFARGTRAIFIGNTKMRDVNKKDEATQKWLPETNPDGSKKQELYLQADSINPIPEYTIPAEKAEEVPPTTSTPTEGW